ncbi:hypothetical protein HIL21_10580 [Staphylococcus aureus]|nr:hypothetical protein [Staphylococcus aureus]
MLLKGPLKIISVIFQLLFGKIGLIRNAITGLVTVFGILGGPITIVIGVNRCINSYIRFIVE